MGLGGYPSVSLAEAREDAVKYRKIARRGGDPFAERDKDKIIVPTFKEAALAVHQAHSASWRNPKHRDQWINTLTEYAFPHFSTTRVDVIGSSHIVKALAPIWLTKPETARRVLQRVGTVLLWAKGNGYRKDAPTDEVAAARKSLPKQARNEDSHHAAMKYTDVPAFIGRLQTASTSEAVKLALEFVILTATRTGEALLARWKEMDLETATWTIPKDRMKAKREHRVPLSARAVELLKRAKEVSGSEDHVFAIGKRPMSNMTLLMAVRRMNVDVTVHGFRSSFKDWSTERTNFPNMVSEFALAHTVQNKTEAAYHRTDLFEKRRELMETWAAFVATPSAKVVTLRASA